MKKTVFALLLVFWSGILFMASISWRDAKAERDPLAENGFSLSGSQVFSLSSSGVAGAYDPKKTGVSLRTIGLSDHVLTLESDPNSLSIDEDSNAIRIVAGRGLFYFSLVNPGKSYEVTVPGARIKSVAKWGFFIDSRNSLRIYSVSSLLDVTLLDAGKPVTETSLFPFMLLVHSDAMNRELRGADTFRIAQIDTLRVADVMRNDGAKVAFGTDYSKGIALLDAERTYLRNRDERLSKLFGAISNQKTPSDLDPVDKYGMVFFNEGKRRVLLKNGIIRGMGEIVRAETASCGNSCKSVAKKEVSSIVGYLDELGKLSPEDRKDGLEIIDRYASLLEMFFVKKDAGYFETGRSPLAEVMDQAHPERSKKEILYQPLTKLCASYVLHSGSRAELDENVDAYVETLSDRGSVEKQDLLPFVFYLKEYLSASDTANADTIGIFRSMVSMADNYVTGVSDESKRFSTLSVLYSTFNATANRIHGQIRSQFFDSVSPNYVAKPSMLAGNGIKIDDKTLSDLESLLNELGSFAKKYGDFYAKKLRSIANTTDSLSILIGSLGLFEQTYKVLSDYPAYQRSLGLSEESRNASWVILSGWPLSKESLISFLSWFDSVDLESLQITNDFAKDGYYDVSVTISGAPFTFRLREPGNVLEEVRFNKNGVWIDTFKNVSVNLDERKTFLSGKTDPDSRFSAFFRTTFLDPPKSASPNLTGPVTPAVVSDMPPEMQVFVEKELIQKDFRNVASVATFNLSNVHAETRNGQYDITLSNVRVEVPGDRTYSLLLSGKYRFSATEHAFENLTVSLTKENDPNVLDLGWLAISLRPDTIGLTDFESAMRALPRYLSAILKLEKRPSTSISIDLASRTVTADGTQYQLN